MKTPIYQELASLPRAERERIRDFLTETLDEAEAEAIKGIQRGLDGMYAGTGEDADEAFASLERELGIQTAP